MGDPVLSRSALTACAAILGAEKLRDIAPARERLGQPLAASRKRRLTAEDAPAGMRIGRPGHGGGYQTCERKARLGSEQSLPIDDRLRWRPYCPGPEDARGNLPAASQRMHRFLACYARLKGKAILFLCPPPAKWKEEAGKEGENSNNFSATMFEVTPTRAQASKQAAYRPCEACWSTR